MPMRRKCGAAVPELISFFWIEAKVIREKSKLETTNQVNKAFDTAQEGQLLQKEQYRVKHRHRHPILKFTVEICG